MNIAVYLVNDTVSEFNFGFGDALRLVELMPDASVSVCACEETFLEELKTAEAAVVWSFRQEWFASAPKLRVLATPAAGRDYFNVVPPKGVKMLYGSFHGAIMAETAVGMILGMSHDLLLSASLMTSGKESWPRNLISGRSKRIFGSSVTILGFGHIGTQIGKLLKPFGCRITGVKRDVNIPVPDWFTDEDQIVGIEKLFDILPGTRHLVSVLPSGSETDGIVDRRTFSSLPEGAFFYNIGRGTPVDEHALAEALLSKRLAGAVLDVYKTEPLPDDSPLRTAPNIVLYPHSSAFSPDYLELYVEELAKSLA